MKLTDQLIQVNQQAQGSVTDFRMIGPWPLPTIHMHTHTCTHARVYINTHTHIHVNPNSKHMTMYHTHSVFRYYRYTCRRIFGLHDTSTFNHLRNSTDFFFLMATSVYILSSIIQWSLFYTFSPQSLIYIFSKAILTHMKDTLIQALSFFLMDY